MPAPKAAKTPKDIKEKDLKQKMAQSMVGTAPSLVPAPYVKQGKAPHAELTEVLPAIDDLIAEEDDRDTLKQLIAMQVQLNLQIKPLEKQKDLVTDRIKAALSSYGITSMVCEGAKVSFTATERKTINPMKLIAAGVEAETIVMCTDITTSSMLKITPAKD